MLKLCALALMLTASALSQATTTHPATHPVVEAKTEDSGPTFPLVKEVHNLAERRVHVGVNMGINNPEGSRGATPELGLEVGFQPLIPFGLSLELSTSKFIATDTQMYKRQTMLVRGTYNFGGDTPVIKYSYLGIAAGAVFLHDGTEMGVAPVMGFDVPLYGGTDHSCSLGFMAKYLFVTSNDPDSLITSASFKYWF